MRDLLRAVADLLEGGADPKAVAVLARAACAPAPRAEPPKAKSTKAGKARRRPPRGKPDALQADLEELVRLCGSQVRAAERIGCSASSLARWQAGKFQPKPEAIHRIADALKAAREEPSDPTS